MYLKPFKDLAGKTARPDSNKYNKTAKNKTQKSFLNNCLFIRIV